MKPFSLPAAVLCLLTALPAGAAVLSVNNVTTFSANQQVNIDDYGALDWAIWKKGNATNNTFNVPTMSKASGTAISNLFLVTPTDPVTYRASTTNTPTWDFSYTGGEGSANGTISEVNGVFHPTVSTANAGVGLSVTLPTLDTYRITLFVAGYQSNTRLTVSLPGVESPVVNTSFAPRGVLSADDSKPTGYFTIDATADSLNSVLTLQIEDLDTTGHASSHVMIAAVAVQIIPEPSAVALVALAGGAGVLRRRRA